MSVMNMTAGSAQPARMTGPGLLSAIDSVTETRGLGVVLIKDGHVNRLRAQGASGASVVVEVRPRSSGASSTPERKAHSSAATEWIGLGLNCGGSVLAWIGVVGTGALAPVTGGASAVGTAFLWGGALASTGQCAASVYRTYNVQNGRAAVNDELDQNQGYIWTMRAADAVSLVGAGGALKEVKAANAALEETGVGWKMGATSNLSRPLRRRLTIALELQGSKRVPSAVINAFVRQKLLDAIGGVVGLVSSSTSGLVNEVVVWITSDPNSVQP
jgi:hypothetical protein